MAVGVTLGITIGTDGMILGITIGTILGIPAIGVRLGDFLGATEAGMPALGVHPGDGDRHGAGVLLGVHPGVVVQVGVVQVGAEVIIMDQLYDLIM